MGQGNTTIERHILGRGWWKRSPQSPGIAKIGSLITGLYPTVGISKNTVYVASFLAGLRLKMDQTNGSNHLYVYFFP